MERWVLMEALKMIPNNYERQWKQTKMMIKNFNEIYNFDMYFIFLRITLSQFYR